ncbi:uncharacterized protein LOC125767440 [Anopheles funestus]|uniref:uncharacterized protein LOC125767440 n=1 Tax=Anopheles funestus TaxID=62324 RepID=UPI0020C72F5F|nr:uncharacterized protein LOC125767440 [Anopheles funestus]
MNPTCVIIFLFQLFAIMVAVSATDDAFNIELKQKDAEVYHEQSFGRNEFNYGYQVERTNSQFQHKVKGPDDVTYGCYGYIDPDGEKHLVYYIADRLGYRLLAPDQPTKVFTDRVANSVNRLDADLQGRKLDEKVVAWNDLYLPSTCRRLNEIVSITPPPTTVSPVQSSPVNNLQDGALIWGSNGQGTALRPGDEINTGSASGDQDNFGGESSSGIDNRPSQPVIEVSTQANISSSGGTVSISYNKPTVNDGEVKFTIGEKERDEEAKHNADDDRLRSTTPHSIPLTATTPRRDVISHIPQQGPSLAPKQTPFPPRTTYLPVTTTSSPPIIRVPDQPHSHPTPSQSNCGHDPFAPRPKYPSSIAQFNGFVFPINRNCDDSGRNTAELLAQMQSLNEMVLKVSNTLHMLIETDRTNHTSASDTCERVLELLNIQQPVPLLVYVPIMVPYLDVGINSGTKPSVNPASYAFAKTCSECK